MKWLLPLEKEIAFIENEIKYDEIALVLKYMIRIESNPYYIP